MPEIGPLPHALAWHSDRIAAHRASHGAAVLGAAALRGHGLGVRPGASMVDELEAAAR